MIDSIKDEILKVNRDSKEV